MKIKNDWLNYMTQMINIKFEKIETMASWGFENWFISSNRMEMRLQDEEEDELRWRTNIR